MSHICRITLWAPPGTWAHLGTPVGTSICDNFLYEGLFQGRTFGAPGLTAQAVEGEGGREQSGRKSGQGDPP